MPPLSSELAGYVQQLFVKDAAGEGKRLGLNRNPAVLSPTAPQKPISGRDLKAFLSFNRGEVAERVLQNLLAKQRFVAEHAEFADFVELVATWNFPAGEEAKYETDASGTGLPICKPTGFAAKYNWPKTQIYQIVPVQASGKVTITVCAEGVLPGCIVRIVNPDNLEQQFGADHPVSPEPGSTFRYSKLVVKDLTLGNGVYAVLIVNDVGQGESFVIGQGKDTFSVA